MTETPMEPVFQDPPPVRQRGDEWQPTVDALIRRTGQWALIMDAPADQAGAGVLSGRIRERRGVWAGEHWEVATRTVRSGPEKRTHVYARHLIPEAAAASLGGEGRD
ncbi:hypothetical protein [Streptosporangium jomthongense]|uniref:Uncharacterized protein n=1 Tax=Streptosporangium jomthongense TaxID=1193683 RepID=A0ABV8FE08_9ACTN